MARSSRGEDARKARRRGYSLARAYAVLFFLGRHPETGFQMLGCGAPLTKNPSLKIFMGEFWDRKFAELVI